MWTGSAAFCNADDGKMSPWAAVPSTGSFLEKIGLVACAAVRGTGGTHRPGPRSTGGWRIRARKRTNLSRRELAGFSRPRREREIARGPNRRFARRCSPGRRQGRPDGPNPKTVFRDQYARRGTEHDGSPDSTRLQETSAQLDQIVRRRTAMQPGLRHVLARAIQDDTLMEFRTQESQIMPSKQKQSG